MEQIFVDTVGDKSQKLWKIKDQQGISTGEIWWN